MQIRMFALCAAVMLGSCRAETEDASRAGREPRRIDVGSLATADDDVAWARELEADGRCAEAVATWMSLCSMLGFLGRYADSDSASREAARLATKLRDREAVARADAAWIGTALARGQSDLARARLAEALERSADAPAALWTVRQAGASVLARSGAAADAAHEIAECANAWRELGRDAEAVLAEYVRVTITQGRSSDVDEAWLAAQEGVLRMPIARGRREAWIHAYKCVANNLRDAGRTRRAVEVFESVATLADDDIDLCVDAALLAMQSEIALGAHAGQRGRLEDLVSRLAARHPTLARSYARLQLELHSANLCFLVGDISGARLHIDAVERISSYLGLPALAIEARVTEIAALESAGQLREAREVAESTLHELGEDERTLEARIGVLSNLGRVLRASGDPRAGLEQHERQLALAQSLVTRGDLEAQAKCGIANCELAREGGDLARARKLAEESYAWYRAAGAAANALYPLTTLAEHALAVGDRDRFVALRNVLDETLDSTSMRALDRTSLAGTKSFFAEWSELSEDWVDLRLRDAPAATEGIVRDGWNQAGRYKAGLLLEDLHERSAATRGATAERAAQALARELGDDGVLVEFAAGRRSLYAYVCDRTGVERVALGDRGAIEARVRAFVALVSDPDHPGRSTDVVARGKELYHDLLAPWLESRLARTTRLVVVPTIGLAGLPFDALIRGPRSIRSADSPFAGQEFVIDFLETSYMPSVGALIEIAETPRAAEDDRVAAFFGDAAAPSDAQAAVSGLRLSPLPHARDELAYAAGEVAYAARADANARASIGDFEHGRTDVVRLPGLEIYAGREASLARFVQVARRARLLHCAVHGVVDERDARSSGLALAFEPANDGLLLTRDIAALELDADLVVLSACNSAVGEVLRGDGVQSLAYAFLRANARSVVATLWPVKDERSARLMKVFYGRYASATEHAARALRVAKLALRNEPSSRGGPVRDDAPAADHPCFWAAFLYVGRNPGPFVDR